jgi:NTE family protein
MPLAKRPRVAWVFSSGGPRGFVHVGVLKALDELRLKPELIVGASVGSLVGALFGSGLSAQAIEGLALELGPTAMGRLAFGSEGGERFNGAPIAELVRRHSLHRLLEDMPVRVACAAVRLRDAQAVALTAGDVGVAVQASAAVEGQFTPVRLRGEPFVDPDWHMPLPVRLARALGARQVIAVDASAHEDRAPPGAERYRQGDLRKRALVRADAQHADLVLHPDFGYWVNMSREFRERSIAAGYRDTIAAAARLKKLHAA